MPTVHITSYGSVHAPPSSGAHVQVDLGQHFPEPTLPAAVRHMTGRDSRVQDAVLAIPGMLELVDALVGVVRGYLAAPGLTDVQIAIGSTCGRHRAVVVAGTVARLLQDDHGARVRLTHRDLHRPVTRTEA